MRRLGIENNKNTSYKLFRETWRNIIYICKKRMQNERAQKKPNAIP